jgi:NADH dehydrogenase [ubiquinone] 1 alpha subcomplex assembly factor 5
MSILHVAHRIAHRRLARAFASEASFTAPTASAYRVFDRTAKRTQKDRAASRDGGERSRTVDYVRDEVADRMMERLLVMCLCSLHRNRTG